MSFVTLHTNLYNLVNGISELGEVSTRPKFDFTEFPGAFVAESSNESEYDSTQDNLRTYAFSVWVFESFADGSGTDLDTAYSNVRDAVDKVIDALDAEESPDATRTLDNNLGAGRTLVAVVAQPSRFAYDDVEELIGAEIIVRLRVLVDLTTL